jgi:hypothetical protein
MAEYKFDGIYKTRRDGGLLYTFHATWRETGRGINWRSTVVYQRKVAGSPFGYLNGPSKPETQAAIEKRIVDHIERQIGVR